MANKILLRISVILMSFHHVLAGSSGDDCSSYLSEEPISVRGRGYSQFVFIADDCREWLNAVNPSYLNLESSNHLSDSYHPTISTIDRQNGYLQSKTLYAAFINEGEEGHDTEWCHIAAKDSVPDFNPFLITTGNRQEWMTTSRTSKWSASTDTNSEMVVCRSSTDSHNPSYPTCTPYINLYESHDGVDASDPYGFSAMVQHGVAGNDCTSRSRWFPVTDVSFIHFAGIISSLLFNPIKDSGVNKMLLMVSVVLMSFHHVSAQSHRKYAVYLDTKRTHSEAKALCESKGQTLATVTTKADRDYLLSLLTPSGNQQEYVWLGLSDEITEGQWLWDDGTPCDGDYPTLCIGPSAALFSKDPRWQDREPNNAGGLGDEDCAVIQPIGGEDGCVNDISCSGSSYTACNGELVGADRKWTIYMDQTRSYAGAKNLCIGKGLAFAAITSADRQALGALLTAAGIPDASVVIGLSDQNHEGQWTWYDGTVCDSDYPAKCIGVYGSSKDPQWMNGEPNNAGFSGTSENCAYMKPNLGAASVNDVSCYRTLDNQAYATCLNTTLPPTTSPTTAAPTVPLMKVSAQGKYDIYVGTRRTDFAAKALCESLGTTLATVTTREEREALGDALTGAGKQNEAVWIGLRADDQDQWAWDDGTVCAKSYFCIATYYEFENPTDPYWRQYEPNNRAEDCAEMYPNQGGASVNDVSCSSVLHYAACNTYTSQPTTVPTSYPTNAPTVHPTTAVPTGYPITAAPTSSPATAVPTVPTLNPTSGSAGDDCSWCQDPTLQSCDNQLSDPQNWILVRAIGPSRNKWYPNTDHLQGTDEYDDNGVDVYNIGSFETFVPGYNQLLFIDGTCDYYLLTSKQAIWSGTSYSNEDRQICQSSKTPYFRSDAKWINEQEMHHPYISMVDWSSTANTYYTMYMEAYYDSNSRYRGPNWSAHNGLFVYIRNAGALDEWGCQSRSYAPSAQFPLITMGKAGDDCSWCTPPDLSSCGSINDAYNWKLVRAIGYQRSNNQRAFPNYDNLAGIDEYMDNGKDIYNIGSFETFVAEYNQFLITTGSDCDQWLIAGRSRIESYGLNGYYHQDVCRSSYSNDPYQAYWYQNYKSDTPYYPYISTYRYDTDNKDSNILYAEGNAEFGMASNGIYVFVRNVANLDSSGCCSGVDCVKQDLIEPDDNSNMGASDHRGCGDVLLEKELTAFEEGIDTIQDYEDYYGPGPVEMKNDKQYDSWIGWRVPFKGSNDIYNASRSYQLNGSFTSFSAIIGAPMVDGCKNLLCETSDGCFETTTHYIVSIKVDGIEKYNSGEIENTENNINIDLNEAQKFSIELSKYGDPSSTACDWIAFADPILHGPCNPNQSNAISFALSLFALTAVLLMAY